MTFPDDWHSEDQLAQDYAHHVGQSAEGASAGRSQRIEWGFTVIGVILAGVGASLIENRTLAWFTSGLALLLVVPLLSQAVQLHSVGRRYSVIASHLQHFQYPKLAREPHPPWQHTADIIRQVDFAGHRVETRLSLCKNTLLMGFGYLFLGAAGVYSYLSWIVILSHFNWCDWPWLVEFGMMVGIIISVIVQIGVLYYWDLPPSTAVAVTDQWPCVVCERQDPKGFLWDDVHPNERLHTCILRRRNSRLDSRVRVPPER